MLTPLSFFITYRCGTPRVCGYFWRRSATETETRDFPGVCKPVGANNQCLCDLTQFNQNAANNWINADLRPHVCTRNKCQGNCRGGALTVFGFFLLLCSYRIAMNFPPRRECSSQCIYFSIFYQTPTSRLMMVKSTTFMESATW